MASKLKVLTNNGKTPTVKTALGSSASKKKSPLIGLTSGRKSASKGKLPEQAFAIGNFGNTGLTGES